MTKTKASMAKTKTRRSALTPDAIAKAALRILKREGPAALSLRSVAEVLGTNHVAVYRRCEGFDGLLELCADHVAGSFPEFDDRLDWATATKARFEAAFDMWAEHADLILLMRGRAWLGINMTSRFYEPAMRSIVDAGFSISDAAALFSMLYRLTIGSVVATRANHWTPWESRAALKNLGVTHFPTLARVQKEVDQSDDRESFSQALQRLIVDFGTQLRER